MAFAARSESFDAVADEYAAVRPGYPDELFEFVVRTAGIGPQSTIVEVGCGTGQATLGLAKRGFKLLCIEPGAELAARARHVLLSYRNVAIEECRFEDWDSAHNQFSLLFSAQAYHWIDPVIAVTKPHKILEPNGVVALIWNIGRRDSSALREAIDSAYERYAPELAAKSHEEPGETARATVNRLAISPLYRELAKEAFPWSRKYPAREYIRLLGTYSDHIALKSGTRDNLLEAVESVILEAGGSFEVTYDATCFMFRTRCMTPNLSLNPDAPRRAYGPSVVAPVSLVR